MEIKIKTIIISLITILIVIAAGIWMIVLQNFNVFDNQQDVYVRGGYIDAGVSGSVSVDNEVDINISSVNGHGNAFYGPTDEGTYDAIHVYTGR